MPLTAGERLGPYEILALIGAGGMGEVYRARDPRLNRDVAIKVSAAQFTERFEREAKAVAALNHPNICHLYDVGPNYLVMEFVEGEAPKGPLPLEEALRIAKQIAEALSEAHDKGITHRDLKPANIKIKPDGTVKVLDFGLAKIDAISGVSQSENSPTLSMAATQMGVILGTAGYMSPEQARGKPVDKRADIWAFGVVLWELITGKRLFEGEDVSHTMAQVITQEPKLDEVPFQVRRLLKKCLEKDPKKRLRDIGDVWELLDQEVGQAVLPAVIPAPSRSRSSWVVAGALAIGLAALAFLHFREQPEERQVLQYTVAAPDKAKNVSFFVISPDGRYLAMLASGEAGPQIWVRSLDSLQTQALAGTEEATYPFWSPDSRFIAFFSQNKLKKISVSGGPPQTLCDAPNSRGGAWSREGVIVFAPTNGNGGISRVPGVGGEPVNITKVEAGTHRWPIFLPDGKRFLYLANGGSANGIYLASLDDPKKARRLVLDEANPQYLAPEPGRPVGHLLFVREGTLMAQPVDPKTMDNKGELFPVAQQISRGTSNGMNLYSISATGILAYSNGVGGGATTQYVWIDRSGKELEKVGGPVRSQNNFGLSPEGKRIVSERPAESSGNSDLWITDMEHGGRETRITFDASANLLPVWSPDGDKVAFGSTRKKSVFNLYQRASNGTGQDELLFESKDPNKLPWDWSHDGRFIIFHVLDSNTGDDIWALPVTGQGEKKPFVLRNSPFRETQGQLSPDGRWLAYTSNESQSDQVYVVPFAPGFDKPVAGKWQISLAGGTQPRWRGDSKELFYVAPEGKLMAVEVKATAQTFDRGTPQPLFELRSSILANQPFLWGYVPSADGKRFLVAETPGTSGDASPPPMTVVVNWLGSVKK